MIRHQPCWCMHEYSFNENELSGVNSCRGKPSLVE
jgi:hypothetical protein